MFVPILLSLFVSSVISTEEVKDGMMYQFTNSLDNNVLTISSSDMEVGSNVTLQQWKDQCTQKFLAVSMKQGENLSFLLVPRCQKFDWTKFVAQGSGSLKDRRGDLPESTLLLAVEPKGHNKFVTQQLKNEKPTQQWQFNQVGSSGKYLIKNVDADLCLKNPGAEKKKGIFAKLKNATQGLLHHHGKKPAFVPVQMAGCNRDEVAQQWVPESHS